MITGFLDKEAAPFAKALWKLLLSAQNGVAGVPQELLDAKRVEIEKQKVRIQLAPLRLTRKYDKLTRPHSSKIRKCSRRPWRGKTPSASATENSHVSGTVNAVSAEATETTESEGTEEEGEPDAAAAGSMTEEAAIAIRGLLPLPESATTDTEALLQRAELTATSQDARTETTLPVVANNANAAALPPTTAPAAAPTAAAVATPQASPPPVRRPASLADAATTDLAPDPRPATQRTSAQTAKIPTPTRRSVATKAADPVRVHGHVPVPALVLLPLTGVAHDPPDATATPTAAEGRPPSTADPLRRRSAAVALRLPHPARARRHRADVATRPPLPRRHGAGVATLPLLALAPARLGGAERSLWTMRPSPVVAVVG